MVDLELREWTNAANDTAARASLPMDPWVVDALREEFLDNGAAELGVDGIFVESPHDRAELAQIGSHPALAKVPLLANMLVRLLWRYQVVRNWRSRRKARLAARRCSKEQSSRQTAEQDTDKL